MKSNIFTSNVDKKAQLSAHFSGRLNNNGNQCIHQLRKRDFNNGATRDAKQKCLNTIEIKIKSDTPQKKTKSQKYVSSFLKKINSSLLRLQRGGASEDLDLSDGVRNRKRKTTFFFG